MKAARVHQFGGPEALIYEEIPDPPAPGSGEALISVAVIGVNFSDIDYRRGAGGHRGAFALPLIPGHEGAGSVLAVGRDVKNLKAGDRVLFMGQHRLGAYREKMLLRAEDLIVIPTGIDFKLAVAALNQGQTAHYLAHDAHPIKSGEMALIHAAAGGVGSNLVQMAKMRGAIVYATVSSDAKAEFAHSIGADHVIVYTKNDFIEVIKDKTRNEGVDVVFDAIGGDNIAKSMLCLRSKGHLVNYGQTGGEHIPLQWPPKGPRSFYISKHAGPDYKTPERIDEVLKWVREGKLKVHIYAEYALADAAQAHRDLEGRQTIGKLLLIP